MKEEKMIPVRRPKIRKNHIRFRLAFFVVIAVILMFAVIFAEYLCPYDPNVQDYSVSLQAPNLLHPAGTDSYGRDMLSRILMGLHTSVLATLALVVIITLTGTTIGVICGYWGGFMDALVMRISDIFLAFPGLVFALAIAAILNGGLSNAVIALAVISWPKYARIARSQTLAQKSMPYIWAARLSGDTAGQIIFRHILPNSVGPILVTAMLDIGTMMMELVGLSYLGLGAQPPTAELGNMMSGGRSMLQTYPWVVIGPGVAIFVAVVIFNLLGDTARDYLDPRNMEKC
ncbi:MAG: ABC transporter permease [Clostridiales bacterium]|nr:ABC transporter permease [Clostridiales bacterium]